MTHKLCEFNRLIVNIYNIRSQKGSAECDFSKVSRIIGLSFVKLYCDAKSQDENLRAGSFLRQHYTENKCKQCGHLTNTKFYYNLIEKFNEGTVEKCRLEKLELVLPGSDD